MATLEVTAQDARDIYTMACKAIGKTERAMAHYPCKPDDPLYQRRLQTLGRLKRLRDAADAVQQLSV